MSPTEDNNKLKSLIENCIQEEFEKAPQFGCVLDKCSDNRPKDSMDIGQHHKMMWVNENVDRVLKPTIIELVKYIKPKLEYKDPVKIILRKDKKNSEEIFGKTGEYNPDKKEIVVYISGRHPKDILRSLAHELVHHLQNERGEFKNEDLSYGEGYAQKDKHMRQMEEEAFLKGNMLFRDWCDGLKTNHKEMLDEFNAMGTGAVVGYMAPLGMDMSPAHKIMHSGDKPFKKKVRKRRHKLKENYISESKISWEKDKIVSDIEDRTRMVLMYRALPSSTNIIKKGDFITPNKKFAYEHAVTSAIYNDEEYQVIAKYVSTDKIIGADNNNEFIWNGNNITGKTIMTIDTNGETLNEEFIGRHGGLSYFQMGGSIKNPALYNKDSNGKPTRNPGVKGSTNKDRKNTSKKLDQQSKSKKHWYDAE